VPASRDPREALRLWLTTGQAPSPETAAGGAEVLAETARRQGVAGLLHTAVEADTEVASRWPASVRERLREMHRALLVHGIAQLDLARRAQKALERGGVRSLPLWISGGGSTIVIRMRRAPLRTGRHRASRVSLLRCGAWGAG